MLKNSFLIERPHGIRQVRDSVEHFYASTVVDNNAWANCCLGVSSGISQGVVTGPYRDAPTTVPLLALGSPLALAPLSPWASPFAYRNNPEGSAYCWMCIGFLAYDDFPMEINGAIWVTFSTCMLMSPF